MAKNSKCWININANSAILKRMQQDFDKYSVESQNKLRSAVRDTTKKIMTDTIRRAGSIVKIRSGNLIRGISMNYNDAINVGFVKAKSPHAHLIEFGHVGPTAAKAYPIMRPSFEDNMPNFIKIVKDAVKP